MTKARRRAAIGVFANTADLDAATSQLHSQGISHCVSFKVAPDLADIEQGRADPPLSQATLGDLRARFPCAIVLRVDLSGGTKEEALVAQTLLASAAQSVQLHDL